MALILSLFLALVSFGQDKQSIPIRLSSDVWVGYSPWAIAVAKKFFKQEGINVQVRTFTEMIDSKTAFENRQVDIASLTLNEILLMKDRGIEGVIFLILDYSAGADALVGQNEILNTQQLKGKVVGTEIGTVSHFTLLQALEKAGLKESEVEIVNLGTSDLPKDFHSKKIQAAATWEPFVSQIVQNDSGRILFSSREIPGSIVDVLVVQKEMYETRRADLIKICKVWFKSLDYYTQNKQEALLLMGKIHGTTPAQHEEALKGVYLTGQKDNRLAFGVSEQSGSFWSALQNQYIFLQKNGLIKNQFDLTDLYTSDIVNEVK